MHVTCKIHPIIPLIASILQYSEEWPQSLRGKKTTMKKKYTKTLPKAKLVKCQLSFAKKKKIFGSKAGLRIFVIMHFFFFFCSHLNWQAVPSNHMYTVQHIHLYTSHPVAHIRCTHMPTWHKAWHTGYAHYRNAKLPVAKETCGRGRVPCCCHSSRLAPCQLSPSGRNKARGGGWSG